MASKTLEKLADKIIKLSPEEGEQLALIIQAKLMPEIQRQRQQQQGLLQQQQHRAAIITKYKLTTFL